MEKGLILTQTGAGLSRHDQRKMKPQKDKLRYPLARSVCVLVKNEATTSLSPSRFMSPFLRCGSCFFFLRRERHARTFLSTSMEMGSGENCPPACHYL